MNEEEEEKEKEEENCSICLNKFGEEECHKLDECNHKFHTKCIINWFRKASTCPNCRDNTYETSKNIPGYMLHERVKYLRKISRKKDFPKELKNHVTKLQNTEKNITEKRKEISEFRKNNTDILKKLNKMRNNLYSMEYKKTKIERVIGLFQSPNYQLPALIIQQCPHYYE